MFGLTLLSSNPISTGTVVSPADETPTVKVTGSGGAADGTSFSTSGADARVAMVWPHVPAGPVRIQLDGDTFSLWASDVTAEFPLVVAALDAIVTTAEDPRRYRAIVDTVRARGGLTDLSRIAQSPEDSYSDAAQRNRQLKSPTWLGLGRDMRTFGVSLHGIGAGVLSERLWDWVAPQWHGEGVTLPESDHQPVRYQFMIGRGIGPQEATTRRLREGILPILDATILDGGIDYALTTFVVLETDELSAASNLGTDYLRADGHSAGHMFTPEQQCEFDRLEAQPAPTQETVQFLHVTATNTELTPRFAFLKLPAPFTSNQHAPLQYTFDSESGTSSLAADRIFCTATLDGSPVEHEETSVLLQPGQAVSLDLRIPHRPISGLRASAVQDRSYPEAVEQCRVYWRNKLDEAASVELPERRISEMVAAGLLHLDLVTYGEEPAGTLAPTIGVYAPIGSESAPIIQFFDSIGRPDLAARSLQYFLDKQHDDGFMQNFGGYMLETEAALWSFGEHFRYTRDTAWVERILPGLDAAVQYILGNRSRQQAAGGQSNGLIVGKTADPEDPFAAFMLNGYAYLGLSRAAEMVVDVDPERSRLWAAEAGSLRLDIRAAFDDAVGRSPVVPLRNGDWVRSAPPWPDQPGPLALDRSNQTWFTHGAVTLRDSLLGPLWLVFQEVLDPDEQVTTDLLAYHADLFFHDNSAFSQPYYSPHPLVHLRRGEVKAFLSAYYTMVASLADPETYSFWEHYFHASPHKTHEEAWFLMQTRWMLYLERGDELRLLPGIPRAWLAAGERLRLSRVRSYFGSVDLNVEVDASGDRMSVRVACDADRAPSKLVIRLPHPTGRKAVRTTAGSYDAATECVTVEPVNGDASLEITF